MKVRFLECTQKITLDEYDFVTFFEKKFATFFCFVTEKTLITLKVCVVRTCFHDILSRTFFTLTYLRTGKVAWNGPKKKAFKLSLLVLSVQFRELSTFAHNFGNIRCTDVKVRFLECTQKITLDEYDFVTFFEKKFATFFCFVTEKTLITLKVCVVRTCFHDILSRTFFTLTYLRTGKVAWNGPKKNTLKNIGPFCVQLLLTPAVYPLVQSNISPTSLSPLPFPGQIGSVYKRGGEKSGRSGSNYAMLHNNALSSRGRKGCSGNMRHRWQ